MKNKRYERAVTRNLHEIGTAILERRALTGMHAAKTSHAVDYFRLAYNALFNDMVAHAIKATDKHKESASFWYIKRCDETIVRDCAVKMGYDFGKLEIIANKLINIRNKTHFHIDKKGVFDPSGVWKREKLTWKELDLLLDTIWNTLNYIYKTMHGEEFVFPS